MQCTILSNNYVSAAKKFSMFFAYKRGNRGKIHREASQTPTLCSFSKAAASLCRRPVTFVIGQKCARSR
jgi:hypothetical protein